MSKQSRLIKNTAILLIGIIGTKLVNFILLPFLTAWLSVEEYGTVDIFLTIVSMVVPFCSLQLEQAVFRFLIDDKTIDEEKTTVSSGMLFLVFVLLILDLGVAVYYCFNRNTLVLLYVLSINLQTFYIMAQQVVRGKGKNDVYTINSIIFAFSTMAGCVFFIKVLGFGVKGYIFSYCLANLIAMIYMVIKSRCLELLSVASFSLIKTKEMLKYSIPMIVNNVSWWILNASDKLVLNIFIGTSANGIFAAAGKIPGLITSVFSVFQMAWQESASREQSENDLNEFYSGVFRSLLVILAYGVIAILLLSKVLFPVLINVKFIESFNHIPILLLGLFFLCLAQFYGGIFVGLHRSKELGWTSAVAAVVNLTVDLISVHFIGIYAASVSTLIAYFVLFAIRVFVTGKAVNITYNYKELIIVAVTLCVSIGASYLVTMYVQLGLLMAITVLYWMLFKDIIFSFMQMVLKRRKH